VYVFSSNECGHHAAGAALAAYRQHGARMKFSYGHMGNSFAIPTLNQKNETLTKGNIQAYVRGFMAYAYGHPEIEFHITRVGVADGHTDEDMSMLFHVAPNNCLFEEYWLRFLGPNRRYWDNG
jgi:hypothetical protein